MLNLKAAGLWSQGCALTLNYILMCFAAFGNKIHALFVYLKNLASTSEVHSFFFFFICLFLLPFEVSPIHWGLVLNGFTVSIFPIYLSACTFSKLGSSR